MVLCRGIILTSRAPFPLPLTSCPPTLPSRPLTDHRIALGLYLAVTKELKETPIFPGNLTKYHTVEALSSSKLTAHFKEWCALTAAGNETFNTSNGGVSARARLWPDLCKSFRLETPKRDEQFEGQGSRELKITFPTVRPYGYKIKDTLELRNSLQVWSKEPRVIEAWNRLAEKKGWRKIRLRRRVGGMQIGIWDWV